MKEIDELNSWWFDFLNEYYEKKPHDGIREYYKSHGITLPPEGISPLQEWERDTRKLCFYDANKVGEAFLYSQTTTVDQGSQIRFNGVKYDVDSSLIGAKVEFTYDPMNVTPQIVVDSFGVLILPECVYESVRNQNLPQIAGGRTARYCRHNLSKVRCYG